MPDIENVLIEGNLRFHLKITQELENIEPKSKLPRYPVLILTCMDPRIDIHRIFQLNPGDVFVLRNGGNLYTQDIFRSVLIAVYQYDIRDIIVLGHLDCGMTKINLLDFKKKVPHEYFPKRTKGTTDLFRETKEFVKPFNDEIRNIKQQIETLSKLKLYKPEVHILGMLYDVDTGWVFEYDKFKEFTSIQNFKEYYKTVLGEKQFQFIDFLETIEDEIIKAENLDKVKREKESDELLENTIPCVLNMEHTESPDIQNQILSASTILTKIRVPKIKFPGVNIHIPRIHLKRNNLKDEP